MPAKWTIIIQISAESNLLFDSIDMFDEMGVDEENNHVNFIVIMDALHIDSEYELTGEFQEYNYLREKRNKFPSVYKIVKGIKYATATPWFTYEDCNLADGGSLERVLSEIKEYFKADNYGYVYSGHAGPGEIDVADGSFVCKVEKVNRSEYNDDRTINTELMKARLVEEFRNRPKVKEWEILNIMVPDANKVNVKTALVTYSKGKASDIKYLSYSDLSKELASAFPEKLSFVLLDCCWGMMLENVSAFQKSAKYLIASVDEMPAQGVGYRHFCQSIYGMPGVKPDELAKLLVAIYYKQRYRDYEDPDDPDDRTFANMGVSLSCVDISYFQKVLPDLKELVAEIRRRMQSDNFASVLHDAVGKCRDYTYNHPMVYKMFNLDLIWFLENLIYRIGVPGTADHNSNHSRIRDLAISLILNIRLYLIPAFLSNNYKNASLGTNSLGGKGISITLPRKREFYAKSFIPDAILQEFFIDTEWSEMLNEYYDINEDERYPTSKIKPFDSSREVQAMF